MLNLNLITAIEPSPSNLFQLKTWNDIECLIPEINTFQAIDLINNIRSFDQYAKDQIALCFLYKADNTANHYDAEIVKGGLAASLEISKLTKKEIELISPPRRRGRPPRAIQPQPQTQIVSVYSQTVADEIGLILADGPEAIQNSLAWAYRLKYMSSDARNMTGIMLANSTFNSTRSILINNIAVFNPTGQAAISTILANNGRKEDGIALALNIFLFSETVRDNVAFILSQHKDESVRNTLASVIEYLSESSQTRLAKSLAQDTPKVQKALQYYAHHLCHAARQVVKGMGTAVLPTTTFAPCP